MVSVEVEFVIGVFLSLLCCVFVEGSDGFKVGCELGCLIVGVLGFMLVVCVLI